LDIENLTNNVLNDLTISNGIKEEANKNIESTFNEGGSNPVGELIEIAQRCSMRPPDFEYGDEEGPPHDRNFTCFAKFDTITESANGRSKKIAKRLAALKLLKTVQNTPQIQDLLRLYIETHNNQTQRYTNATCTRNSQVSKSSSAVGNRKGANTILNQIKASQNRAAKILLDPKVEETEANLNKALLDSLSTEENFTYRFYKPNSESSKFCNKILTVEIYSK
jgi:hypothetical protein